MRHDATTGWLRPDAAKFKIQNLAAPRGQILNFEFWRKSDDGDATTATDRRIETRRRKIQNSKFGRSPRPNFEFWILKEI